jgi:uncharacterized membrane protein YccC
MPPTKYRNRALALLAEALCQDQGLLEHLEQSFIPEERDLFVAGLDKLVPQESRPLLNDLWRCFATYCQ